MNNKAALSLLLTSLLLVPLNVHAATYYRWVDENKVTHYTSDAPEGREYEVVKTMGGKSTPTPRQAPRESTNDNKSAAPQVTDGSPKKDKEICKTAQENLRTLQDHALVRQKNEYGEEVVLTDEQKEKEIQRAKQAVKTYC